MATPTTESVRLPPGPRVPKIVQGVAFLAAREEVVAALARRYGGAFTVNLPIFGRTVVIGDPILVKDLFSTAVDLLGRAMHTFGAILGPGSTWGLDGGELLERRRLLAPPFHGKRMRRYEHIIEEEVMREVANWPGGREFETLPSMLRITLNANLRAVFGAEGPALDELRELIPPAVKIASRIALLPPIVWRDFGPWSPGGRFLQYRRRVDPIIDSLIADARADPAFEERSDVLALLLRARSEDGEPIPDRHIVNELLTLLAAGYETTSASLAWATLLREFRFAPTDARGERRHNRGVMIAPGRGGRAVVYRRTANASSDQTRRSAVEYLAGMLSPQEDSATINGAPASASSVLDALFDSAESAS